jgi:hypothetical protein
MRPLDPAALTPDVQLRELARILAAGLLRLHRRPPAPALAPLPAPKNPPKSVADCLELPGEMRLSVHTG